MYLCLKVLQLKCSYLHIIMMIIQRTLFFSWVYLQLSFITWREKLELREKSSTVCAAHTVTPSVEFDSLHLWRQQVGARPCQTAEARRRLHFLIKAWTGFSKWMKELTATTGRRNPAERLLIESLRLPDWLHEQTLFYWPDNKKESSLLPNHKYSIYKPKYHNYTKHMHWYSYLCGDGHSYQVSPTALKSLP